MKTIDPSFLPDPPCPNTEVRLDHIARWNVYNRLQELSIACECHWGTPLQVRVGTVTDAIQLWSVIQLFTSSRQSTVEHLERCWQQRYRP